MPNSSVTRLKKLHAEAQALLAGSEDAMHEGEVLSRGRKLVHFAARVYRSFVRNRCPGRAAALAYTTVLAIVPLLAVVLSVSTGLLKNESDTLKQWIDRAVSTVAPQLGLEVKAGDDDGKNLAEVTRSIQSFVDNFQSGKLGVTAIVALIFVAISLLSTVEQTFNDIWGIRQGRAWFARIVQYWAAITLGPLFLLAAFGLTSATHLPKAPEWTAHLEFAQRFLFSVVAPLAPFVILSAILALMYLLVPNTKVQFRAAVAGGCVAGCLLQLNNLFNVMYLSRVVTYKQIYGGLAAVPLFLLGLYFSWIIVLLGAQVAYAFQNRKADLLAKQADSVNQRGREFIALRLMTCIGQRFQSGERPLNNLELAEELGVASSLVSQILNALLSNHLLVEVTGEAPTCTPARPLDQITAQDIIQALRTGQGQELATSDGPARQLVRQEFEQIQQAEAKVAGAVTLRELVSRVGTGGPSTS